MKLLYVAYGIDLKNRGASGVYKKISGQSKSLCNLGCGNGILIVTKNNMTLLENDAEVWSESFGDKKTFFELINKALCGCDGLYLRATFNTVITRFMKYARKNGQKIAVEIPTFPVWKEMLGKVGSRLKNGKILYALKGILGIAAIELYYLPKTVKNADLLVTIAYNGKIRGKKVTEIRNGLDMADIRKKNNKSDKSVLSLIGVANISYWHGFDRVINGIANYREKTGDNDVRFIVVGDGEGKRALEELAQKRGITDAIVFTGFKSGKEKEELFDKSDAAVGTLAAFRQGLKSTSTLKFAEYCARGIPIIAESTEDYGEKISEFVYCVPSDDTPVDIEQVKEWYKKIENKSTDCLNEYAEKNMSWDKQMKTVVNAFAEAN